MNACCTGCRSSPLASDSIVSTFASRTSVTGVLHENVARPLTSTVHAPQLPSPQPYFVPVRCSSSRSTSSSVRCGSDATSTSRPFTLSLRVDSMSAGLLWQKETSRKGGQCIPQRVWRRRSLLSASQKILSSADFCLGARCAPGDANAQRAASFGRLGTIGFVLNDWWSRANAAPIPRGRQGLRSMPRAGARRSAHVDMVRLSFIMRPLPILGGAALLAHQRRAARGRGGLAAQRRKGPPIGRTFLFDTRFAEDI